MAPLGGDLGTADMVMGLNVANEDEEEEEEEVMVVINVIQIERKIRRRANSKNND